MAKGGIGCKGQGLPLNIIVLAAIAVLVLVLVVAFTTGSISKLFGGTKLISDTATPDQVTAFRIGCQQACFQAQQLSNTENSWGNSSYCGNTLKINGKDTHCWGENVTVECSKDITLADGSKKTCTFEDEVCKCNPI